MTAQPADLREPVHLPRLSRIDPQHFDNATQIFPIGGEAPVLDLRDLLLLAPDQLGELGLVHSRGVAAQAHELAQLQALRREVGGQGLSTVHCRETRESRC
ncbi:hypothetical protein GCM10010178_18950 [Lentzea flava]|uniref:Uncharacterized protein n=1 Tax=Lentzea flava TaxID=103732 RepID=A0ABQ2UGX0_9PSEU|nr:hypothetical protein GCM10010178_18950 [Lentzea flava]